MKAIIDMAHALGLSTVAEGVEEPGQRAVLTELGCGRAQGYLFARPLPAAQFAAYAGRPRLLAVGGCRMITAPVIVASGPLGGHLVHVLLFAAWIPIFAVVWLREQRGNGLILHRDP